MKITICAYDAPGNIDGPTAWIKRLLPFLNEKGIEARILFIAANTSNLPAFNEFVKMGFACKLIPWELFWEEKIRSIIKDIKEFPPDVFIPNYFPVASYVNFWIKKAGIPSIIVLHNDNEMQHALVDEFAGSNDDLNVAAIAGVSKMITKMALDKNIGNVKISCIPCGTPVPNRVSNYKEGDTLKLIYAGRLNEEQKRASDVAKVFCRVVKEIPGTEAVIYGSGGSLKNVLSIIEAEGKGFPVKYGGVLKSDVMLSHLLEHHVFVLLSNYEGIPITLMEAMGCGLVPVCTSIRSGITELIDDKHNGLLVSDRGDEFVSAIKMLKNDPARWTEFSVAAKKRIVAEYSDEIVYHKWLELIKEIAAQNEYQGKLKVPSVKELKKIKVNKQFELFDKRMPSPLFVPFYKLKFLAGRIKRKLFFNPA